MFWIANGSEKLTKKSKHNYKHWYVKRSWLNIRIIFQSIAKLDNNKKNNYNSNYDYYQQVLGKKHAS